MIVYFDTSALVKRYVSEAGSDQVLALWTRTTLPVASWLLYPEVAAAFARRKREQAPNAAALDQAYGLFGADWLKFHRVPIDDEIARRVDELVQKHPLRGADAVHLASALTVRDAVQTEVIFACADNALKRAASAEGLKIIS